MDGCALAGERRLLAPNHPTNDDPALLFALAKAAGMPFYYLCCREAFDHLHGLWGALIQRLGAYSVVRGTTDRDSFQTTRVLLAAPAGKVVIFPEGEMHSQNDTLLPFHAGVVQLAFWALEDLRKAGDSAASVSLLPVGLRYFFTQDMTQPIDDSLRRLERAMRLPDAGGAGASGDPYARIRRVGVQMLEVMEAEYGLKAEPAGNDLDLTPRMNALKSLLLDRAAGLIGVPLPIESTLPERMRLLINSVYTVTHDEAADGRSPYQMRVHRQQAARAAPLLSDLNRVANWIAVQDNYVRAHPTPERMADTLRRLEIEAFGKAPTWPTPRAGARRRAYPFGPLLRRLPRRQARHGRAGDARTGIGGAGFVGHRK